MVKVLKIAEYKGTTSAHLRPIQHDVIQSSNNVNTRITMDLHLQHAAIRFCKHSKRHALSLAAATGAAAAAAAHAQLAS
jgi:hypothetical protein